MPIADKQDLILKYFPHHMTLQGDIIIIFLIGAVYTRHPWGHCIDTRQYDNKAPPCPAVPTTAGEELPLTAAAAAGHD